MIALALIAAALLGAGIAYLWGRGRYSTVEAQLAASLNAQNRLSAEKQAAEESKQTAEAARESIGRDLLREQTERQAMERRMAEREAEFKVMGQRFQAEFENLANRIFDEKDKVFRERSAKAMDDAVKPLRDKLGEFQKTVTETERHRIEQSAALKEQIKSLSQLNETMRGEAANLTKALKGDSKVQGNWGEMILERLLEKSGLERDREYSVQGAATTDEGRRLMPDVVLHLPDDKHLVIDAKVSLTAYERYIAADDESSQDKYAKAHVDSLRAHIKGLSAKNYPQLYGLKSVDFVLLFVPVEPAFSLAMRNRDELFMEAFQQNVVLVTPTTLLATLRTIAHVWKQEKQSQNVVRIAEEAGRLHDKFAGLLSDLDRLGGQMQTANKTYDGAMKKLSEGTGNLVGRVDKLRKLGASAKKPLPPAWRERALLTGDEDSDEEDGAVDDTILPQAPDANAASQPAAGAPQEGLF